MYAITDGGRHVNMWCAYFDKIKTLSTPERTLSDVWFDEYWRTIAHFKAEMQLFQLSYATIQFRQLEYDLKFVLGLIVLYFTKIYTSQFDIMSPKIKNYLHENWPSVMFELTKNGIW